MIAGQTSIARTNQHVLSPTLGPNIQACRALAADGLHQVQIGNWREMIATVVIASGCNSAALLNRPSRNGVRRVSITARIATGLFDADPVAERWFINVAAADRHDDVALATQIIPVTEQRRHGDRPGRFHSQSMLIVQPAHRPPRLKV